ncbi:2OG-Fe(II) oxygenase family protein [Spirillospora sp. NPDC048911]|uniref:2OG-Fe(II) oxygenase family protein n=1 Tax=Spirillospora sp. NPDC048911 TaxID=3364527 RepID=UPI00371ED855
MSTTADEACRDLIESGYSMLDLDASGAAILSEVLRQGRSFFSRSLEAKSRYSAEDPNFGYLPMGKEYSISPERPDLNERFALWSDRVGTIPNSAEIMPLTGALLSWRDVLIPFLEKLFHGLARHFGSDATPTFKAASYLQLNNYMASSDRDLLQDRHEDGHLLTVIYTTGPGLEIFPGQDSPVPVETPPGKVLVMPASVLADLTGGAINALDHQVRNHRLSERMALMYFVNPELFGPLHPWVGDSSVDLREKAKTNPAVFGLPEVPVL